jgi:hypothetical protein
LSVAKYITARGHERVPRLNIRLYQSNDCLGMATGGGAGATVPAHADGQNKLVATSVRVRTTLINTARGLTKTSGYHLLV